MITLYIHLVMGDIIHVCILVIAKATDELVPNEHTA